MTLLDRALPWHDLPREPTDLIAPVIQVYSGRRDGADASLIERAFLVADQAHADQLRKTGEAFIHHPVAVAHAVADLGLDDVSIAAAVLHDSVEDTAVTLDNVREQFGEDVAALVDGLTKLDRLSFESKEAQQAATMRKMLVAMARDWRVLIIKLCDRLHNMRTLGAMREDKAKRIAQETLDIYAPLAHRLGMQEIKQQLEDLAFSTLHPKRYAEIAQMVATRSPERETYLARLVAALKDHLNELGIEVDVTGRPKHLWSIYEKMVIKGKEFDEIHDLVGIRLLVDSVKDCYATLGSIHAQWKPVQGRFKDYIAMPKFNLYQSLHTTVIGPDGKTIEVQIRTHEMHVRAELGIAAHWSYKENVTATTETPWLQRIVDWQVETTDPDDFLETLKNDLEQDEVFVFTPKGDVMSLAVGATPIDFAYAVHSDVGHRCIGARVNGRLAPLDTKLQSGDSVEVFTSKVPTAGPSRDWLKIAATTKAKNKIRQWFSRERREDAIDSGRDELVKAMRREGLAVQKILGSEMLVQLGRAMNYNDLESFYVAIGDGHVSAHGIAQRLYKELHGKPEDEQEPSTVKSPRVPKTADSSSRVHVEGLDDVWVRMSKCCTPVPGDEIVGFVTRGRGVSVHRADCANAVSLQAEQGNRLIEVEWDDDGSGTFVVSIEIISLDRPRLLLDITRVLVENHVSILSSTSAAGTDRVSRMKFEFLLGDTTHLTSILNALKRVDSVYDVYRVVPGQTGNN
jgi:GTP diphosphokinase / guanosine-3',5'-bis(diphosphate) 3'-diphosphatase